MSNHYNYTDTYRHTHWWLLERGGMYLFKTLPKALLTHVLTALTNQQFQKLSNISSRLLTSFKSHKHSSRRSDCRWRNIEEIYSTTWRNPSKKFEKSRPNFNLVSTRPSMGLGMSPFTNLAVFFNIVQNMYLWPPPLPFEHLEEN